MCVSRSITFAAFFILMLMATLSVANAIPKEYQFFFHVGQFKATCSPLSNSSSCVAYLAGTLDANPSEYCSDISGVEPRVVADKVSAIFKNIPPEADGMSTSIVINETLKQFWPCKNNQTNQVALMSVNRLKEFCTPADDGRCNGYIMGVAESMALDSCMQFAGTNAGELVTTTKKAILAINKADAMAADYIVAHLIANYSCK
jgi:hypothetical protein